MILRFLGWLLGLREAVREIGRTESGRGGGRLLDRELPRCDPLDPAPMLGLGPPRVLP